MDRKPENNKPPQQPNRDNDPRKNPKPGYDEKNPSSKKNIQDHPENQNTG